MRSSSPPFTVWLRRVDPPEGPFIARYEVRDGGRGALRIAQSAVVVDPPARERAEEPGLTVARVRAARFLVVPAGAGPRGVYSLGRVDPGALHALPKGEWVALEVVADRGGAWLVLPATGHRPGADEPDPPTAPLRVWSELRAEIEAPRREGGKPGDGVAGDERTEARVEPGAPSRTVGGPAGRTDERTETRSDERTETRGETRGETRADERTEGAVDPLSPAPSEALASVVGEGPFVAALPVEPPGPTTEAVAEWPGLALHHRSVTAIRHLRRRLADLEAQNRELVARLGGRPADEP